MRKKLTTTLDEQVYKGLHQVIDSRRISRFIEDLVRPHVVSPDLEAAYMEMGGTRLGKQRHWSGLKPPLET